MLLAHIVLHTLCKASAPWVSGFTFRGLRELSQIAGAWLFPRDSDGQGLRLWRLEKLPGCFTAQARLRTTGKEL